MAPTGPEASGGDGTGLKHLVPRPDVDRTLPQVPRPAAKGGWPTLFGPHGDNSSSESGIRVDWPAAGPPERWSVAVGLGYSAPVVADDRLILFHRMGDEETVDCLNPLNGQPQWRFAYPTSYTSSTLYSEGPYATPVIHGSRVYTIGAEGNFHCLELASGSLVWQRELNKEFDVEETMFAVSASPLVVDDRVILNLGGAESEAGVVALDKQTGATVWKATQRIASCATPRVATIHGRSYVFAWTDSALACLGFEDGEVIWEIPFRAKNPQTVHGTSPLVYGDVVLVCGYQLGSLCLRILPGGQYEVLWCHNRKVLDSQYTNLLCIDGCVYGFSTVDRSLRCVDLMTGDVRWSWRSKITCGNSIAVDGRMLIFGERGRLACLDIDPDEPVAHWHSPRPLLAGRCFTAPALSGGLLYLRNEKKLICLDLRRADPTVP